MSPSAALLQLPPERMTPVLRALQRIAGTAAHACDTGAVHRALAEALAGALDASAAVATVEMEGTALRIGAGTGLFAAAEGDLLPVAASLAGAAFSSGTPRATGDVAACVDAFLAERELPAGAYLAVPLMADGRAVAVALAARARGERMFGAADAAALAAIAEPLAGVAAAAQAQEARRRAAVETAAARNERELREEVQRLQAALREATVVKELPVPRQDPRMLRALIGAVRQELGEPLSVVSAEAQGLAREWIVQAEPALERAANAIHDAARRLTELAARLEAAERDPADLVITSDGRVDLRASQSADEPVPQEVAA